MLSYKKLLEQVRKLLPVQEKERIAYVLTKEQQKKLKELTDLKERAVRLQEKLRETVAYAESSETILWKELKESSELLSTAKERGKLLSIRVDNKNCVPVVAELEENEAQTMFKRMFENMTGEDAPPDFDGF
ncbi:MAG: hypothetical protein GF387_00090 [Candidatus Portnoybacteria bacterium]|nr:hypothetical protein [Candidatus Portnoybacteria bacterium]